MSYEIPLYPRQPGQDWDDVIAADEVDGPALDQAALDAGVARFRRIEARLREQLTEPVEVWVAEETDGDVFGELTGTESGLRVELYDRSAAVSFPVRPGTPEQRSAVHDAARRAVRVVTDETGYEAYDLQTRRTFDGLVEEEGMPHDEPGEPLTSADAEGTTGTTGASAAAANPLGDRQAAAQAQLQRMDPAMLRRRSMLYLVLGGLMALFALWQLSAGESGWLTWLLLALAIFNLFGGLMLRAVAQQATAQQASDPQTDPQAGTGA